MDKYKQLSPITDNLNKALGRALEHFSSNTEWTDINNWLLNLESIFKDNASPFINEKALLAKRLNQCTNPILPEKVHECVLRVHQIMFFNMRASVDKDMNDYVKLFAEDLGTHSLSILPFFAHTSVSEHRMFVLNLLNEYYLDLGRELIPMLGGFAKALLPVYSETTEEVLQKEIYKFIFGLLHRAGRRYVIAALWSSMLKYSDCRAAGMRLLSAIIDKMEFIQGEEDYQSSHGFSAEEEELREQEINQIPRQLSTELTALIDQSHPYVQQKQEQPQTESPIRAIQDQAAKKGTHSNPFHKNSLMHIQEENEDESQEASRANDHSDNLMKNSQQDLRLLINFKSRGIKRADSFSAEPSQSLKLNRVPLMVTPGIESIKEGIDEDSNYNNYPHHSTLVVGSLISCLEDPSQLIKRGVLDFMFSHLRLKSQVLCEGDKRLLVQAVLRLFRKKQISITKRVNRWLFGKQNEQNQFLITDKNSFVLPLIIEGLNRIFQLEPEDEEECVNPLKIAQNLYMEHCHLLDSTMNQVSLHLLRYIFNYSSGYDFSQAVVKAGKRFFENIPSYYTAILSSLGSKFIEGVAGSNQHLAFESVRYIDYCYIQLMHHEHGIEELEYITLTLEYLSSGLEKFADMHVNAEFYYDIYLKDTNLLVCNLLSRRRGVIKFMDRQKKKLDQRYMEETGMAELPEERLKYQGSIQQQQARQQEKYVTIAAKLEKFFIGLGARIRSTPNVQIYEDVYRLVSMAMVKVQVHIPSGLVMNELPKWFDTISSGIKVSNPSISLAAIEAMIKCLLNEESHCVYSQFRTFITQDKSSKAGNDYQNLALQKLWGLLDFPHMHHKIIDLIVAFSKFFPYEFTQTVKKSFSTHSDPEKQASIQRFSHFWRLTGFKYKDLLLSNRQFAELNKIGLFKMLDFLDDQNPLVRHSAKNWMVDSLPLFNRILEPLFFELMKVCGDWYTTPKGLLVIRHQYDTSHIFSTFRRIRSLLSNGSYAFLRYVYSKQISDSLQSLRSKITDLTSPIFCDSNVGSPQLAESTVRKEPVLPRALEMAQEPLEDKSKRMTYIDILVIVSVKFVEGHALESMGIDFYTGNAGVNTSSIELLETMLDYIDNPKLCYRLVKYIIEPLCRVLKQAVVNQEYITQIQLLGLLRTIFFSSSFRKKGELEDVRAFFKNILTEDFFLESMLKGLYTPFSYVRAQFINFITTCIQLIADFLEPAKCTECIKRILFTYHQIIKEIKCSLVEEVLQEEEDCTSKLNEVELRKKSEKTVGLSRIVEMEIKAKQEEKLVKLSNNLQEVAKTNEILSILHGVSAILNYFFDFDKMNINDMRFEFSNPYTFFDTFKSIVTLGFGSSEKTGRLIEKTEFLHNMQTCQSILEDMSPVYETILRAWPLSEEFVRIATEEFTSVGSRVFNFEKFSKYNQVLKNLIVFVAEERESIWGKIFSIMQPMFYKFPREMTEIYLRLWLRECTNAGGHPSEPGTAKTGSAANQQKLGIQPKAKSTEFLMKILQTITVSNFPMQIVTHAFLETQTLEQIRKFYEDRRRNRNCETLSYPISQKEAKLLYFLYVYFMYSKIDEKSINKDTLIETWSVILKSVKPFLESRNPTTAMWVLDIIEMCATKYPPKEILANQRFKTDLHAIINQLLKYIAGIAAKKLPVFYEDPTRPGFETGYSNNEKYRVVLPIPPSLFEIYKLKRKDKSESDVRLFQTVKPGDLHAIEGSDRLWAFKMLKKIGFKVLQSVYLSQKMHFGVIRACEWVEIILPAIQNKSAENMLFAETASEVLHCLLASAKIIFIKPLRNSILKIFNKQDFFICNKNMLKYWAEIIDWIVSSDKNNETFAEYLSKVSLSSSYFTSENEQNKKRIKSFERICFILYSGQKDKYAHKIKALLLKIADVIRVAESVHPALLILILFSIRILIMRLSEISLNQLFIDIWPMILAFLMQIFCKQMVKVEIANEISRNHNLLFAAIKLIEMISVANLGEFAQHQWIFVYDYFGVKLSLLEQSTQMSQILSQRPELTELVSYSRNQKHCPFYYKPYLINYLSHYSIEYVPEEKSMVEIEYEPRKRIIIAKNSFVKSEEEVACYVLLMAQYLAVTNEYRIQIDKQEMEEVIVNDFIQLDSFIHHI